MRLFLFFAVAFAFVGSVATGQSGPMHLIYQVEVKPEAPGNFHFSVEVTNPASSPSKDDLTFVMPYWAPGAYRPMTTGVRAGELAVTGFQDFTAVDENGAPRAVKVDGERRWKVDAKGCKRVTFRYTNAGAGDKPNNRSYLAAESGLIDGPRSYVYVDGMKDLPCHVRFRLPETWQVGTGLDPTFDPFVFHADDYDRLVDCPTVVGLFKSWNFEVRGVPHRLLVVTGTKEPSFDPKAFIDVLKRVVETYVNLFDDVPYQHYTFIFTSGSGGGLEHLTSTTIAIGPTASIKPESSAGIAAHEFFHTWNVKRLRPSKLGPFDYTGPVSVKDLWICEGITSYYGALGLWRAGFTSDANYLRGVGNNIANYQRNPSHTIVSPEEASATVFDKARTHVMDYYLQGELHGLMIDLQIREGSNNKKSFDDVMRRLYRTHGGYYRHGPALPGYESEDVVKAIREETGVDLTEYWNRHIRSAEEIPWNRFLASAGWRIETKERTPAAMQFLRRSERGDSGMIVKVESGDMMARAGFKDGDLVLNLNGLETNSSLALTKALVALESGKPFEAKIQRNKAPMEVKGTVEPATELGLLGIADRKESGGIIVNAVPSDTGLYQAGFRRGDLLRSFEGAPVTTVEALRGAFFKRKTGETVTFEALRDAKLVVHKFKLAPRRVIDVGKPSEIPDANARALAIRRGLKEGTANGL